jgi:hypothetical protein
MKQLEGKSSKLFFFENVGKESQKTKHPNKMNLFNVDKS